MGRNEADKWDIGLVAFLRGTGSIGIVDLHVHKTGEVSQAAAHDAPLAKCALTMSHEGKELATNIPRTSRAIEGLALEAAFQDLGITQLLGQMLVAAIKKDILAEILRDEVPLLTPSAPRIYPSRQASHAPGIHV